MLDSLSSKFSKALSSLRGKGRIKNGDVDDIAMELRSALIESDVALEVIDLFIKKIQKRTFAQLDELNKGINPSQAVFDVINEELTSVLEIVPFTPCLRSPTTIQTIPNRDKPKYRTVITRSFNATPN